MSYLAKETCSLFGRAVHNYGLVRDGDQVAVGLSGGKDSLSLLWLLAERRRRVPIDFGLKAVWIDMGLPGFDGPALASFCRALDVELIALRADWDPAELGGCYPCARQRRKRLFQAAEEAGCGVVALGHNLDDAVETFFMNLIDHASASTILPKQDFFSGRFQVIRPLILISAAKLDRFAAELALPVQPMDCPLAGQSSRAGFRGWLEPLYKKHPRARENIFRALTHFSDGSVPGPMEA